jgi:hypothetical protein
MCTRISTVYKYVKERYPISKEHRRACDHKVENPCARAYYDVGDDNY